MIVYRIVKDLKRANDLSGMGAFRFGGRWNSAGTYMLYTSENRSLAYLESLVNFDAANLPPRLYIMSLELTMPDKEIYTLPTAAYPKNWQLMDNFKNKTIGDGFITGQKHLALKVASAVNPYEFNYLLNPLFGGFGGFGELVKVVDVEELGVDGRLFG